MTATASDNEIQITRLYDAPVNLVWDAWTDPAQVTQWWDRAASRSRLTARIYARADFGTTGCTAPMAQINPTSRVITKLSRKRVPCTIAERRLPIRSPSFVSRQRFVL